MSRSHDPGPPDRHVREILQQIAQQKTLVHRMIVQGTPTQAAEDRLRELQQIFSRMKDQRQRRHASAIQRAIRSRTK
jgi:hypothetical protein